MHTGNQTAKYIGKHSIINGLCMDYDSLVLAQKLTDTFFYYLKKMALVPSGAQYQMLQDVKRIRGKERPEK